MRVRLTIYRTRIHLPAEKQRVRHFRTLPPSVAGPPILFVVVWLVACLLVLESWVKVITMPATVVAYAAGKGVRVSTKSDSRFLPFRSAPARSEERRVGKECRSRCVTIR